MDELDTQLAQEIANQKEQETQETQVENEPQEGESKEEKQEPKVFDENYVKALRAENARYRRQLRETENSIPNIVASEVQRLLYGQNQYPQGAGYQQGYQPQGQEVYDPRVDDMILANKLGEIKADPYFGELFNEIDEEGRTFEEKLLEKAYETSWPISELDALVFKMEKEKLIGKVRQKGIDEAYKSMSAKAQASGERNVSSGRNTNDGEVETIDDAVKKAMKEHGITSFSELR
jgi:hypothetical protein